MLSYVMGVEYYTEFAMESFTVTLHWRGNTKNCRGSFKYVGVLEVDFSFR